jgi:SAM-dependent methyltransferase
MVHSFSKDSRPERAAQGQANEYYDPREANRYTETSNSIQKDLTYKALELLGVKARYYTTPKYCPNIAIATKFYKFLNIQIGLAIISDLQKGEFYFIADIGCGSGLSSRILSLEGHPWVGTDISLDMLSLAQNQDDNQNGKAAASTSSKDQSANASLCRGYLTASDMSQGLPFRNSLDFVISISAVQWLCYNKHPKEAAERFFKAVWRCLRDSSPSRAAFQVYLESKCLCRI